MDLHKQPTGGEGTPPEVVDGPDSADPAAAIASLLDSARDRVRHIEVLPARTAKRVELPDWVDPGLAMALRGNGVSQLWSHQREAADLAHLGHHVVLATGTASGKSLGYLLPGLTAVAAGARAPNGRGATLLYLAPTKALAADQLARVSALAVPGVRAASYDGDTPFDERRWIREHANVIFTNPDLLHHSLLPRHQQWASVLRACRFVVIDECHAYRGIFGSNVALVLRRLRRVLARYRADPTFVLASATVSAPAEHAQALLGMPVRPVTADGSPRGAVTFALWEPPVSADADGNLRRRSALSETAEVMSTLVGAGVSTLTFARSRAGAEAVASSAARQLRAAGRPGVVAAYRGGYLPEERRQLERDLRNGALTGLAATNALELGIDIHGLDAVVMAGWPGRLASLWQQAGRAGRAGSPSLAVLVGADDPLDTFVLGHPETIFGAAIERTVINPTNPNLLERQLGAAAYERPLTEADEAIFGPQMWPVVERLVADRALRRRPAGWFWPTDEGPLDVGSLRSSGAVVAIAEGATGRIIGTVDASSAHHQVHAGAVHVHQGESYVVTELDLELGVAKVVRGDPGWSTVAQSISAFELPRVPADAAGTAAARPGAAVPDGSVPDVAVPDVAPDAAGTAAAAPGAAGSDGAGSAAAVTVSAGRVVVRSQVVSFLRRLRSGEVVARHPLDLPEQVLHTEGVWWTVSDEALAAAGIGPGEAPGALHAAEHAAIGLLPLFASCDRWDIGGVSTARHPDTGLATVLVYDGYSGGAGFARRGHEVLTDWLSTTRTTIAQCPCESGCPRCVQSPKCGSGNQPLDKALAIRLLDVVLANLP